MASRDSWWTMWRTWPRPSPAWTSSTPPRAGPPRARGSRTSACSRPISSATAASRPPEMDRSLSPHVELVTGLARLEELAGPWEALRARCPGATPFQSPAWLIPWWRAFGRGGLRMVALHRPGRLAGMAPLYLASGGAVSLRWLLLGSGNTDHLDVLAEPGAEDELAQAVAEVLEREEADQADFLQL